jgi:hypothetical protein
MPRVYHLSRHSETWRRPEVDENGLEAGRAPSPNFTPPGGCPPGWAVPGIVNRLIHCLHFLAAALRRGRPLGSILKSVALLTDISFLLGLGGRRFCILVSAATVTTHKRSPFCFGLGEFPFLFGTPDRYPEASARWASHLSCSDNSYLLVIITLADKSRASFTFFPGEEIF